MSEYYIRQPESEEARGPFDLQRIADLVEADQADTTTLYYEEDQDDWIPITSNPSMREVIFPEKKHLSLKAKESIDTVNYADEDIPDVSVDDMLAAAEGKTEDTRHLKTKEQNMEKAASLSLPALGLMMLFSVFALVWPSSEALLIIYQERDYSILLDYPLLIVGLFDAFLMLCCFLNVTDAFPLIRLRFMVGLGYFGYVYWTWDDIPSFLAAVVTSIAIYICTTTLNVFIMGLSVLFGIAGAGALAAFAFMATSAG